MSGNSAPAMADADFRRLQTLMAEVSGIRLSEQKRPLVAGRLMQRLRVHGLHSYGDYVRLLDAPDQLQERRLLIDLLTTNETYFFREPQHFEFLAEWFAQRRETTRLWSAACSSGEEPYSLAMVASEHARGEWSVLASDLSQRMLEKAREGVYHLDQARRFPPGWLKRYCLRGIDEMEGRFAVHRQLRDRVKFQELNLTRPVPQGLGTFDLIFLRNVLIYFEPADKKSIIERLIERLTPQGLLFVGHAESLHGLNLPLRAIRPSVYQRL
ncbi:MAG: CheR family methyltransferase [Pseudomonas sp.]|uniref:CheR family methyltransferase n=1 Tax=Pseudomonas sp. TaxID=306 RepID=UPI00339A6666